VGEAGAKGVDIGIAPWPSDHRGILVSMEVTPSPAPPLVAAWPMRVRRGETLRVRVRNGGMGARVVLVPKGTDPATISAAREATGELTYATKDLIPGAYEVVLFAGGGKILDRAPVRVSEPGTPPEVHAEKATVKAGEAIDAVWTNAPGNRWDWVGIYAAGVDPKEDESESLLWKHTRASVDGKAVLDKSAEGPGWPLKPGKYRLYLFEDDAYKPMAGADVTVTP
jgi:hypothetical protein